MPNLHRLPNGDFIDYGRHWRLFGKQGDGPARLYSGEAAEVMRLFILKDKQPSDEVTK